MADFARGRFPLLPYSLTEPWPNPQLLELLMPIRP
jgi:hypothetical protein